MENKELEIYEWGLILDENTISSSDFIMWSGDLQVRLEKIKPDTPQIYYNQAAQKRTRNWCTNYAAFGCISDMFWYTFSKEDILEIHDLAEKKYGWEESSWNYLYKAVDCLRDWWNKKFPEKKIISFRVDLLDEEAQRLIEAWKTLMIGYQTTKEHAIDAEDNGNLDSDSFKSAKKTWGHAIRHNEGRNIDNYFWLKKFNTYDNKKLKQYVKEWTYFQYGYVFFEQEESIFTDLPKNHPFYSRIKSLYDKGIIKWYEDGTIRVKETMTRWEVFVLLDRVLEYAKKK